MNKSFHYYCIRVLAEKAGFSPNHAQTIAYASQYTDDSTEHGRMTITNMPAGFAYPRWDSARDTFDPICTAHAAHTWMGSLWKWAKFYLKADVQRKILMPFHFLPPEGSSEDNKASFDFVTQKNSVLSNAVLDEALKSVSEATDNTYPLALIKLGIALHSFADTWSHAGFSGRHSSVENDIKKIGIKEGKRFKSVNPLQSIVSYAAPDVGHAEAATIPDSTDLQWTAKYANTTGRIARDNPQEFLAAAETIFKKLASVSQKPAASWQSLSSKISKCLEKKSSWENSFPEVQFDYSRFTWRTAALDGDSVDWDDFDDEADFHKLHFRHTGHDARWLLFHKAAFEQRMFLRDRIPQSWMNA